MWLPDLLSPPFPSLPPNCRMCFWWPLHRMSLSCKLSTADHNIKKKKNLCLGCCKTTLPIFCHRCFLWASCLYRTCCCSPHLTQFLGSEQATSADCQQLWLGSRQQPWPGLAPNIQLSCQIIILTLICAVYQPHIPWCKTVIRPWFVPGRTKLWPSLTIDT